MAISQCWYWTKNAMRWKHEKCTTKDLPGRLMLPLLKNECCKNLCMTGRVIEMNNPGNLDESRTSTSEFSSCCNTSTEWRSSWDFLEILKPQLSTSPGSFRLMRCTVIGTLRPGHGKYNEFWDPERKINKTRGILLHLLHAPYRCCTFWSLLQGCQEEFQTQIQAALRWTCPQEHWE